MDSQLISTESMQNLNHTLPVKKRRHKDSKADTTGVGDSKNGNAKELTHKEKESRKEKKRQRNSRDLEDNDNDGLANGQTPLEEDVVSKSAKKLLKAERKAAKRAKQQHVGDAPPRSVSPHISSNLLSTPHTSIPYAQHPNLSSLPQEQIDSFVTKNFVSVTNIDSSEPLFRPIIAFSHLPNTYLDYQGFFKSFKQPTPIQAGAWPYMLAGRDVIGIAETGSGKTMAFAVPCINRIKSLSKGEQYVGPKAVVIAPTRELAMQSYEQINKLAAVTGLRAVCIYGGVPKDEQRTGLKTADIIVATPGRLNDLIDEGSADLSKVSYLVLDEADRMLDKGFEDEIRKIIGASRPLKQRQTLMFTATWPESVRELANTFMTTPVKITIGDSPSGDLRANNRIVQKVEVVDPRDKEPRLLQLLKQYQSGAHKDDRILVFCLYKKEASRVEGFLRSRGVRVTAIHGDLSQEQRTRSLGAFKQGTTPVLVATDVAARGLDIPAVKLVINLTYPLQTSDYVHRIGRTGRAGMDGLAITLFTDHDKAHSGALINVLKAANQPVPEKLLKFGTTVKKKGHEAYGAFFKELDTTKTATKIKFD